MASGPAKKTKSTGDPFAALDLKGAIKSLQRIKDDLQTVLAKPLGKRAAKETGALIEKEAALISEIGALLDPIKRPQSTFDPSNPAIVGRVIALTLSAQERVPLGTVAPFYGSGVYAIYYKGAFDAYKGIAGTEHPIYVGKADPETDKAREVMAQGVRLHRRLNDHVKSIKKADNLDINDFECRFLVVSSGWQVAAEEYLIRLFKPIWNSHTKLCFGIGKHGDAAETRANGRSPWDTMHPGRPWAASKDIPDQKPKEKIVEEIENHLRKNPPYMTNADLLNRFIEDMRQLPKVLEERVEPVESDDA